MMSMTTLTPITASILLEMAVIKLTLSSAREGIMGETCFLCSELEMFLLKHLSNLLRTRGLASILFFMNSDNSITRQRIFWILCVMNFQPKIGSSVSVQGLHHRLA
ncbi:hypothetical protein M758_7G097200 [Ceratodon purpureus]|nr:hypothetical protein M758_7G097200 [Ceratodon purpureus]